MKRILPLCFVFAVSGLYAQTVDQWVVDGIVQFKIDADPGFDLANYAGGNIALDLLLSTYGVTDISQPYALPATTVARVSTSIIGWMMPIPAPLWPNWAPCYTQKEIGY